MPDPTKNPNHTEYYNFIRRTAIFVLATILGLGSMILFSVIGQHKVPGKILLGLSHVAAATLLIMLVAIQYRNHGGLKSLLGSNNLKELKLFIPLIIASSIFFNFYEYLTGIQREEFMASFFDDLTIFQGIISLVLICTAPPISEEIFYRHFMLRLLPIEKRPYQLIAIIATALIFAASHQQYNNISTFISIMTLGILLAWARLRTNGLSVPIVMHATASITAVLLSELIARLN